MPRGKMFWIDPRGRIVDFGGTHILAVINHPEKFGTTKEKIQSIYDKHGEELTREGKAREEIIKDLTKKGFIRVRFQRNYVSVTVGLWAKKAKQLLSQWAKEMVKESGIDKYQPVKILSIASDKMKTYDLIELSRDVHMYENNGEYMLQWVDSIDDFGIEFESYFIYD